MILRVLKSSFILVILISSQIYTQAPDTVWVDDDYNTTTTGWGVTHFAVIQDGIDAVAKGGTVYVAAGKWNESVDIQDGKSLIGAGIDQSTTTSIAIGNTGSDTESIIKNFTLDYNSEDYSWPGLSLELAYNVTVENIRLLYRGLGLNDSHNNTISNILMENGSFSLSKSSDNVFKDSKVGTIWVVENSTNNVIEDNSIYLVPDQEGCTGIRSIYSSNNIYRNNTISGFRVHILLSFSNGNIVNGNNISGQWDDPVENGGGVVVFNGNNNIIINNKIDAVCEGGITLFGASCNNLLQANVVTNTDHGIELYYDSNNNDVINNTVQNDHVGIILDNTSDNIVYRNNIINCDLLSAYDDGNNEWSNDGTGNYWSEYTDQTATDSGYVISPGGIDHHPAQQSIPVANAGEQPMIPDTHLMLQSAIVEVTDEKTMTNEQTDIYNSYEIKSGGKLVLDHVNWNIVAGDCYGPLFLVDSAGSLTIKNSTIHSMGGTIDARFGSALDIEDSELTGLGNWDGSGGITVYGADAIIKNNTIKRSFVNITLNETATGARIINNKIAEANRGIIGVTDKALIEGNTVTDIILSGIRGEFYDCTIRNNIFRDIWQKTIVTNKNPVSFPYNNVPSYIYNNDFFNCGTFEIHEGDYLSLNNKGNFYSDYLDKYPDAQEHSQYSDIWDKPYTHLMSSPDIPQPHKNDNYPLMYPANLDASVQVPGQPQLLSPSSDAVITPTNLEFSWNPSSDATAYRLQVSDNTGFATPAFNKGGITGSSKIVNNLDEFTNYYWRVLAENSGVISDWSNVYHFTTDEKTE